MSENCNKSCGTCAEDCAEREAQPKSLLEAPHECSDIKKVIAVVSGKGGVGKSLVSSMLAVSMSRMGYQTAILDADVTGPSIPKAFGIKEKAAGTELGIMPGKTKTGIDVMSVNLILENDTDPVIWRGPIISGMVKQFWTDVMWGDVDFMFVDMPPGTGDVPLTVFQSLPIDGIVIVTSPQDLVSMIVAKAVKMAEMMNIPIIGLVENMSYLECPDCHSQIKVFGESHIEEIANSHQIKTISKLPLNPALAELCDKGMIELFSGDYLKDIVDKIENSL
jgi:ATPases involved in chromosome partitioning